MATEAGPWTPNYPITHVLIHLDSSSQCQDSVTDAAYYVVVDKRKKSEPETDNVGNCITFIDDEASSDSTTSSDSNAVNVKIDDTPEYQSTPSKVSGTVQSGRETDLTDKLLDTMGKNSDDYTRNHKIVNNKKEKEKCKLSLLGLPHYYCCCNSSSNSSHLQYSYTITKFITATSRPSYIS